MLGRSASQAKNCHGCCEQMKCCPVAKQEEKAQPTQPTSSSRPDVGFGNILAVTSKDSVLLYLLSCHLENSRVGVRRPQRRSRPSRRFHGDAQILRRLDQRHLGGKGLLPAGRSSWGTLIGTTAGIIGKFSIGLLMILWFLVAAFVA